MGGIPWFQGAPDAFARAGRARRQMGAVNSLVGDAGQYVGKLRGDERQEDLDNAEMAMLRARLGLQENAATDQSAARQPWDEKIDIPGYGDDGFSGSSPDTSGSFPAAQQPLVEEQLGGPNAGAEVSASSTPFPPAAGPSAPPGARRSPTDAAPDSGQPEVSGGGTWGSSLQRVASHYLAPIGLMRDTGFSGRKMALGRLAGMAQRQMDETKRVAAISRLLPYTEDPGAVLQHVAPSLGIGPGQIKNLRGMAVGGIKNRFQAMLAAHGGDPRAALDEWNKTTGGQVKTPFEAFLMDAGGDYHKALDAYQAFLTEQAYRRSPMGQMDRFRRGPGAGGAPPARPGAAPPSPTENAPPDAGTPGVAPQGPSLNDQVDDALSNTARRPDGHIYSGRFKLTRD